LGSESNFPSTIVEIRRSGNSTLTPICLLGALVACVAADGRAQARPGSVDITIAVYSPASAHVDEHYHLGPSSQPLTLQLLGRPCARIENVAFERNGARIAFAESRNGRWTTWRDTTAAGDTISLAVSYDVTLAGGGAIPLMHLGVPLARKDSDAVTIRFMGMGEVEFPHMTRQAAAEWAGRYVAVPSFVKVEGTGDCAEAAAGDNGGLVWRFFLFVGIMFAWVPLYLAWARRSRDNA
jgi:hypothetical protein